jgi:2,4-dienoyl-CoA reductase-like NADH-dependent reductase (Old Yellow Enzyme family)
VNSTDNLEGGMNIDAFPEMASALEKAGVDAIEISGMPYDRRGRDLNASPHFEEHARRADVQCPLILTGGLRDVEQCEELVRDVVSFVGLCRPLLCQPDLPSRWLSNREDTGSECISCNSCQYSVRVMKKDHAVCLYREDAEGFRQAQEHFASDKSG